MWSNPANITWQVGYRLGTRQYAQPNVRETTARYYKGYIDHHVLPRLGDIPLNKLTSLDIQQFYKDLLENGRIREDTKPKTGAQQHDCAWHPRHAEICAEASRAGALDSLQSGGILYPAQDHETGTAGDPVGTVPVLPARGRTARCAANVLSGAGHGTSEGEIAALLWSDYDAQTQTIHVTKQYLFYNGQGTVSPPKSSTSVRYVSIP